MLFLRVSYSGFPMASEDHSTDISRLIYTLIKLESGAADFGGVRVSA